MNTTDWKFQNELIFAQPSNLKFVRGTAAPRPAAAIEVCAPRKPGHVMDVVVVVVALLAVILGLHWA